MGILNGPDLNAILEMLAAFERRLVALEHAGSTTNGLAPASLAPANLTVRGSPRQRRLLRPPNTIMPALLRLMEDRKPHTVRELAERLGAAGISVRTNVVATSLNLGKAFRNTLTYTPPPKDAGRWAAGTYTYRGPGAGADTLVTRALAAAPAGESFFAADLAETLGVQHFALTRRLRTDPRVTDLGHDLFTQKDAHAVVSDTRRA